MGSAYALPYLSLKGCDNMRQVATLRPGERAFVNTSNFKSLSIQVMSFTIGNSTVQHQLKEPIFLRPTIVDPIFEAKVIHFVYRRKAKVKQVAIIRFYTKLGLLEYLDNYTSNQLGSVTVQIGDELNGTETPCTRLAVESYGKSR